MRRVALYCMVVLLVAVSTWFGINAGSTEYSHAQVVNPIVLENTHTGTTDWKIPDNRVAYTQLQAYASATSVLPGQRLTLYVSTEVEGTPYRIDIYRLGWYAGTGGRLMTSITGLKGHAQGNYDDGNKLLSGCNSCYVDTQTGLVEANWTPSYTLTIPATWTTGIYLAKFTDVNDMQTYTPFDVRDDSHSAYVVVTPDTTYAAYNVWGGYSLYKGKDGLNKAVKVSFDRPYYDEAGSSQVLTMEADAIHWLESQGYDVSYMSDIDVHEEPTLLLLHKAYLSLGHDEYWTKEMRDGVEYARDHGVGLAFLGANAIYWQMRFEPDRAGNPDRTVVCYKVQSKVDLQRDPLYGKDNSRVTSRWRDPVVNRPENSLIGIMYSAFTHTRRGFAWQLASTVNDPLLVESGLVAGNTYGCDLVGYEWDRVFKNGTTPVGLQVLSTSQTITDSGTADVSNTTYYIARSGAMVFASGSIYWATALDDYQPHPDTDCPGQNSVIPGIQKLMAHVMEALIMPHTYKFCKGPVHVDKKSSIALCPR